MLRICILVLGIIGFADSLRAQGGETTIINITWTEEMDRSSPDPRQGIRVTSKVELRIGTDGKILQSTERKSGQYQVVAEAAQTLGKEWRVATDNAIYRDQEFVTHLRRYRVIVAGRACTLSVHHELKAGQSEYATAMLSRPGVTGRYSRIQTVNTSCSIR